MHFLEEAQGLGPHEGLARGLTPWVNEISGSWSHPWGTKFISYPWPSNVSFRGS